MGRPDYVAGLDVPMTELWRLSSGARTMRCLQRDIRGGRGWDERTVAVELYLERDGEMYRTELHRNLDVLRGRSAELQQLLLEKGWR